MLDLKNITIQELRAKIEEDLQPEHIPLSVDDSYIWKFSAPVDSIVVKAVLNYPEEEIQIYGGGRQTGRSFLQKLKELLKR